MAVEFVHGSHDAVLKETRKNNCYDYGGLGLMV